MSCVLAVAGDLAVDTTVVQEFEFVDYQLSVVVVVAAVVVVAKSDETVLLLVHTHSEETTATQVFDLCQVVVCVVVVVLFVSRHPKSLYRRIDQPHTNRTEKKQKTKNTTSNR